MTKVKTESILETNVGFLSSVTSKTIERIPLKTFFEKVRAGQYEEVLEYRGKIEGLPLKIIKDKDSKYSKHKQFNLPCILPSSIDGENHNGIFQIDIDVDVNNLSFLVDSDEVYNALSECPYVFAFHKSAGGVGYVGYCYSPNYEVGNFWAVCRWFIERGIFPDFSRRGEVKDKRYVSFDENLVVKETFLPVEDVEDGTLVSGENEWGRPNRKTLLKKSLSAFSNWITKNGCFDWQKTGVASPAGVLGCVCTNF